METQLDPELQGWEQGVRPIRGCRICGNPHLRPVMDLGKQALAGLFDDGRPQNQSTPVPLEVVRCDTEAVPSACGFVQLKHTVPHSVMFNDYGYRSGINTTMRTHLEALAAEIEERFPLKFGDIAVDIGANDGTSLLAFRQPGLVRVGFEPSRVRPKNPDHGIHYIENIFNSRDFETAFPHRTARIITSIAMFYDVDDPLGFCRQIRQILSPDGAWVMEMSDWGSVLDNNGFDAVCHEHLGYYTLSTLGWLFEKSGLKLYDVTFNQANGGSLRCTVVPPGDGAALPAENRLRIEQALSRERAEGVDTAERVVRFRESAQTIRQELRRLLAQTVGAGKKVYGYGASTKGNVLLQYCGVTARELIAIADRNPDKKGRRTPGTRIPICSEEEMRAARPDFLLILPWHFLDEFLRREEPLRRQGTRFIVPFPQVRVL